MAFGIGRSFKKAWKKTLGWTDDKWITDYIGPIAATAAGAYFGGPMGALAASSVYQGAQSMRLQEKQQEQQKRQLAAMQDIANREAAAAALPINTSVTETVLNAEQVADTNFATERRRALSMSDTRTSQRLQRWAKNGKRRTL